MQTEPWKGKTCMFS